MNELTFKQFSILNRLQHWVCCLVTSNHCSQLQMDSRDSWKKLVSMKAYTAGIALYGGHRVLTPTEVTVFQDISCLQNWATSISGAILHKDELFTTWVLYVTCCVNSTPPFSFTSCSNCISGHQLSTKLGYIYQWSSRYKVTDLVTICRPLHMREKVAKTTRLRQAYVLPVL